MLTISKCSVNMLRSILCTCCGQRWSPNWIWLCDNKQQSPSSTCARMSGTMKVPPNCPLDVHVAAKVCLSGKKTASVLGRVLVHPQRLHLC